MYSTCMFCQRSLGTNEAIEEFTVGRRLAFDAERGRLWVVCPKCERWNLTPMEERWEAVEACERIFRGTRVRVSTENIGLARDRSGLELVRIGRPHRPEFAAWRYGDQFGRRRKRAMVYGIGGAVVVGGIFIGGVATGVLSGALLAQLPNLVNAVSMTRGKVKVQTDKGRVMKLTAQDLKGVRLRADEGGEGFRLQLRRRRKTTWFEGGEAERLAGVVLPKINRNGAKAASVQDAVTEIERLGHPERFLAEVVTGQRYTDKKGVPGYVNKMPVPTRLALEMSLHEEQERRALEGELWRLERAWEEAEEIAAISDDLLLPEGTEEFISRNRD